MQLYVRGGGCSRKHDRMLCSTRGQCPLLKEGTISENKNTKITKEKWATEKGEEEKLGFLPSFPFFSSRCRSDERGSRGFATFLFFDWDIEALINCGKVPAA